MVGRVWNNRDDIYRGDVDLGEVNEQSASYISRYVTKKMTSRNDERLLGRAPEFATMSRKNGGIGAGMMWDVGSTLLQYDLVNKNGGDVPASLRHGAKNWPLGRYLKGKLRETQGMEAKAPQSTLDKAAEELLPLRYAAKNSKENPSVKQQIIDAGTQKVLQMEFRRKLMKKGNL